MENIAVTEAVVATGRVIDQLNEDDDLLVLLAAQGFGPQASQLGAALHGIAQRACEECRVAVAELALAETARNLARARARRDYADFCRMLASVCGALSLQDVDRIQQDIPKRPGKRSFVVQTTASYLAALRIVPAERLAAHHFSVERLHSALAQLHELARCETTLKESRKQIRLGIAARNQAVAQLNTWVGELLQKTERALGPLQAPPVHGPHSRTPRRPRPHSHSHSYTDYPLARRWNARFGRNDRGLR